MGCIRDVPSTTPCVHCGVVGNVRWERVLTGTISFVEYYCGRCEHVWRVEEGDERSQAVDRRRGSRPDRRHSKAER
jgi:hypothetical protein